MKSHTTASIQQTKPSPAHAFAGMVNAASNRKPRNLLKFDAATLLNAKTQK
jgi:hypothetical protein